jgi:TonB family protein
VITRFLLAVGVCVLWTAAALAQTMPAAQVRAAMERAQREADGPRRRILEAARLRTAIQVPGATAQPVQPGVPTPSQRVGFSSEGAVGEGVTSILAAAAPPLQMQTASFAMSGITSVTPVALATSTPSMISVPSVPTAAQLAGLPPPRLLSRVDPDLPSYLLRRGARRIELVVEMVVNADGSVRDVALPESPGSAIEESVVAAVRQWRFEPQPAARPHLVRLVVTPG